MADRLGDLLVGAGLLDDQQLGKALNHGKQRRIPIGQAVVSLGFAEEGPVWRVLAKQHKLPFVDLQADVSRGGRIKPGLIDQVPAEVVEEHRVIPVAERDGKLVLAVDDPLKTFGLDTLQFVLDRDLGAALSTPAGLSSAMAHYYGLAGEGAAADVEAAAAGEDPSDDDEAPVIRLVSRMIAQAVEDRASDIHV